MEERGKYTKGDPDLKRKIKKKKKETGWQRTRES